MAEEGKAISSFTKPRPEGRTDLHFLLLLFFLVISLRGWLLYNTEVTARDSIGYIRYALEFEKYSWQEVLLNNHQHPGYPLTIWVVSWPVRYFLQVTDCFAMQLSAQLASSLAALLLIFPMYYLGKFFFNARVGFWGTLLFQYMPVSGHHLSDGISEALFLLFTSLAFLFGVMALRKQALTHFIQAGGCCGLAYLTRPEGAMVLAAALAVLVGRQLIPAWRQSWPKTVIGGLAITLSGLAVGSLYFGFTGTFSNKPNFRIIVFGAEAQRKSPEMDWLANRPETGLFKPGGTLQASIFAASYRQGGSLPTRMGQGIFILFMEFLQIFQYLGLLAVILGMFWHRQRLLKMPEFYFPLIFVAGHFLLTLALAAKSGYISDRHLMVITAWWVFFAAAGLLELPGRLAPLGSLGQFLFKSKFFQPATLSWLLVVMFVVFCLPRTTQKIHGNRVGNHVAGMWLAQHIAIGDYVEDDHSWSHFYAGQVFQEDQDPLLPAQYQPTCYVVMTRSQDQHVGKVRTKREESIRSKNGQIVFHWPENQPEENARIVVYALPRDFKAHPWRKAPATLDVPSPEHTGQGFFPVSQDR